MALRPELILSLCAGGAGLDLGVGLALPAARTIGYVEIEAYAGAVLVSRMEEGRLAPAPVWTDLHTFPGRAFRGGVDGVIAGYPCQPFSAAGRRRGADDSRDLWPAVKRVIEEVSPDWCFLENAATHLHAGFVTVARDLCHLGYRVAVRLLSAQQVGAPHGRTRLFALALADTGPHRWHTRLSRTTEPTKARRSELERGRPRFPAPPWSDTWRDVLVEHPELAPALFDDEVESVFCGMVDGLANRVERLRLLGNGVVPHQAAYAFRLLVNDLVGNSAD